MATPYPELNLQDLKSEWLAHVWCEAVGPILDRSIAERQFVTQVETLDLGPEGVFGQGTSALPGSSTPHSLSCPKTQSP